MILHIYTINLSRNLYFQRQQNAKSVILSHINTPFRIYPLGMLNTRKQISDPWLATLILFAYSILRNNFNSTHVAIKRMLFATTKPEALRNKRNRDIFIQNRSIPVIFMQLFTRWRDFMPHKTWLWNRRIISVCGLE